MPPTGGGGVQQPSLSGQGGHGAAASHVGTVALHPELSAGRGGSPGFPPVTLAHLCHRLRLQQLTFSVSVSLFVCV